MPSNISGVAIIRSAYISVSKSISDVYSPINYKTCFFRTF